MNIKEIYIDGYRNIVGTTVMLDDITSVLSANNYGKSNLLYSMIFGLNFMQRHSNSKQQMMKDVKCIPMFANNNKQNFKFEIVCETEFNNSIENVKYGFEFRWSDRKNKTTPKILNEYLQISENQKGFTTYIKRDETGNFYKSSLSGRCSNNILIEDNELILNKLTAFDDLYYLSIIKKLLNINAYIDAHFDSNKGYQMTFMSEQELNDLSLRPELNIPKTLYKIRQDYPDKYTLLINSFKSLFPDITHFVVEDLSDEVRKAMSVGLNEPVAPDNGEKLYILYVKNKNLQCTINFNAMSDGAKRILLLLTFIIVAQINNYSLICIEEPENSINPSLLKGLLIAINALKENTKVIYSSHSPHLINYMSPQKIYLGIPNDNGTAQFLKIKSNNSNIKKLLTNVQNSELQLGDYLFDLMCGDEKDKKELLSYVK